MTDKQRIRRIYLVKYQGKQHLVRAGSQAQAIRHIVEPMFKAEVATPDELVACTKAGVHVEDAKAD